MTCEEFLARYSEYLDDRMTLPDAARWRAHVRSCDSCARYHRTVERGCEVVRALPPVEPSPEFEFVLRRELEQVDLELEAERRSSGPSTLAVLSIAAVLALVAWSPLLQRRASSPTVDLAPMHARAPAPALGVRGLIPTGPRPVRPAAGGWWREPPRIGTTLSTTPVTSALRARRLDARAALRASSYGPLFYDASTLLGPDASAFAVRRVNLSTIDR